MAGAVTVPEARRRRLRPWERVVAVLRWLQRGRRESGTAVFRRRLGDLAVLEVRTGATRAAAPGLIRGLCAAGAELAASSGLNVATVGLVPGEPPRLSVRAPRRDLVAAALETHLAAGAAHRAPTWWLLLRPGVYLAQVVDPQAELLPDASVVRGWFAGGGVAAAAGLEAWQTSRLLTVSLTLYGAPSFLRRAVRLAREAAGATAAVRRRASAGSAGRASTSEKPRLQR